MELQDMSCCGLFELVGISDFDCDEEEYYNSETGQYETREPFKGTKLARCKKAILEKLEDITPRPRMVIATTIPNMRTEVRALRALHFQPMRRFLNGNSGNRVCVWSKIVR